MPSPAPTPSHPQSLLLLQHLQRQQQQQQLHSNQHHGQALDDSPLYHSHQAFAQSLSFTGLGLQDQLLLPAQKLKLFQLQQQQQPQFCFQQQPPWLANMTLSSNSSLSPVLTASTPRSGSPLPVSSPQSEHSDINVPSMTPSADYCRRRTSATFRSSLSMLAIPSFETFEFGPDDFLKQQNDDSDVEDEEPQRQHQADERNGEYRSTNALSPTFMDTGNSEQANEIDSIGGTDDADDSTGQVGVFQEDRETSGGEGASEANLGNLFPYAPDVWHSSSQQTPVKAEQSGEPDEEEQQLENRQARTRKQDSNDKDNENNTKSNQKTKHGHGPIAQSGKSFVGTIPLDLRLDLEGLQSLSALSLISPQSAKSKLQASSLMEQCLSDPISVSAQTDSLNRDQSIEEETVDANNNGNGGNESCGSGDSGFLKREEDSTMASNSINSR
ncbi:hypothetical protein BX616_004228 [Lobosporangium transversale]|nr:hypothetical protein BX616_004228 [Lobosporangium transversale]